MTASPDSTPEPTTTCPSRSTSASCWPVSEHCSAAAHDEPADAHASRRNCELGDLRIDTAARRVWRRDEELDLTKTEFDLLELLVRNAGIVLDHSTIYERIWNYDFGPDSKNLAVYIGYLRRKTEAGGQERLIHTVRGVGYVARTDQPRGPNGSTGVRQ